MSSPIHFPRKSWFVISSLEVSLPLWVAYTLGNSENYGAYGFKESAHLSSHMIGLLFIDTNALSDLVPSRRQ